MLRLGVGRTAKVELLLQGRYGCNYSDLAGWAAMMLGLPTIRGPNMDPKKMGSCTEDSHTTGPQFNKQSLGCVW